MNSRTANKLYNCPHGSISTESYLRILNQFSLSLIEITNVDDLVWHVAMEVVGKLDFVDCVIYLADPEQDILVQSAAIGEKSPEKKVILNKLEIPIGQGITGTVAKTCKPLIIEDISDDERYIEDLSAFRSEICVPMVYEDQLIGVIDSEHPEIGYFNRQHLEILNTIAAFTSVKIIQCRNQKQLRAQASIINQVSEAVLVIRIDGTIVDCNPASEVLYEHERTRLIGTSVADLFSRKVNFDLLINEINHSVNQCGLWKGRLAISNVDVDVNEIMTEVSVTRLIDKNIEDELYIIVTRNISELVQQERLERELQQAHKMESLGHLTGGIAHDFNNLLAIISGYSEMASSLSEAHGEVEISEALSQIERAARRAASLVSQLLSYSRSAPLEDKALQLSEVILAEVDMLRSALTSANELVVDIEPDVPEVNIDATKVHQLLMNLCVNARDAMCGAGTVVIKLCWKTNLNIESSVSRRPVHGDWVELSIKDNGSGIDKENIHKIFNPFFTTKCIGNGTGMGLSVVYKIIEEYGGHILIDSTLGLGTTIRFLFKPAKQKDSVLKI